MYRILVAVDGSAPSQRAVDYAARRALGIACRVDVVHVEKSVMAWEVGPLASGDTVEQLRSAESAKVLVDCAARLDPSIPVERHVITGEPAEVILDLADKLGADEIVVGSHGVHPLGAVLLGSVATQVVSEARVPVVIVR